MGLVISLEQDFKKAAQRHFELIKTGPHDYEDIPRVEYADWSDQHKERISRVNCYQFALNVLRSKYLLPKESEIRGLDPGDLTLRRKFCKQPEAYKSAEDQGYKFILENAKSAENLAKFYVARAIEDGCQYTGSELSFQKGGFPIALFIQSADDKFADRDYLSGPDYHVYAPRRKNNRGNGMAWTGKALNKKLWYVDDSDIFRDIESKGGGQSSRTFFAGYLWRPNNLDY